MLEIFPLAEFPSEAVGKANCAVLSTLKASVRNCSLQRSVNGISLNSEKSRVRADGAVRTGPCVGDLGAGEHAGEGGLARFHPALHPGTGGADGL